MAPRTLLVATASAALAACSGYNLDARNAPPADPTEPPPPAACLEADDGALEDIVDVTAAATALACGAESRVAFEDAVAVFDDWDDMVASAAVVRCAESEVCGAERPAGLGLMVFLATLLGPPEDVALAAGVDAELVEPFVTRVERARAELQARAEALDPVRQEIYVDLPVTVWRELEAMRQTFAPFAERYAALRDTVASELSAGDPRGESAEALRTLRREYVADCVARSGMTFEECLNGPIARPTSMLLLRHAIIAGDGPSARVELDLLSGGADRGGFMEALAARQGELRIVASQNHVAANTALTDGAEPDDVADLYGPTADAASDPPLPWMPAPLAVGASDIPGSVAHVTGLVDDVDATTGGARLSFARLRVSPDAFACSEGDALQVLWAERRVEMEDCDDFDGSLRLRPDAVVVESDTVLSEGMVVEVWVDADSRRGRVWRAYADRDATAPVAIAGVSVPD